ncbi:MAG: 50S ribosomal protein L21 [Firmicutes bacterium]|nr:50S ribosomal protein L21 [Bacillota bacterium]
MKAVIETGGKQYYVEEGTELYIEKLDVESGKEVTFDKVLMLNGVAGRPYLNNVTVTGEVVKHGKNKKIKVFKYNQKKNYHRTQGHRQPYTKVVIKKIVEK